MSELPLKIKEAVHNYYIHRQRQTRDGWDKEADLDLIDQACISEGWHYQAVAGTFWFSKKRIVGTEVIKITEDNLPKGGKSNVVAEGETFGAFSEITTAMKKIGKKPLFINGNRRRDEDQEYLDPNELEIV